MFDTTDQIAVNAIRTLSIDQVEAANSGHPGLPMGAAPMAYALWADHLNINPKNSSWFNRDRFILSAGHGSAMLYSLLHLAGFNVTLDDLKNFRQLGKEMPGHPEVHEVDGVEATTGPLGQGIANAVGMAMAEAHLQAGSPEVHRRDIRDHRPVLLYLRPCRHPARRLRCAHHLLVLRGLGHMEPHLPQGKALAQALSVDSARRRGYSDTWNTRHLNKEKSYELCL